MASVAFNPDRRTLAAAGGSGVKRWDVSDPAATFPAGSQPREQACNVTSERIRTDFEGPEPERGGGPGR